MCRYGFKNYKLTYGCFKCRVGFKRPNLYDVQPEVFEAKSKKAKHLELPNEAKKFRCPNCGGPMANLGRDLRLPPKTKDEQWQCIKYLYDNKYNIYSCGCNGIGFVPHKMEDAVQLVKDNMAIQKLLVKQQVQEAKKNELEKRRKKNTGKVKNAKRVQEIKKER
jgi:hypothetical protein